MNLTHSLKTITAEKLGLVSSNNGRYRGDPRLLSGRRECLVDMHWMRLATVIYRKIALSDKLLDSPAIRYGDKAGYLIVL
jgi:hypothetical protein